VTRVHSVAGLLEPGSTLRSRRPFRAPHHSVTEAGLVGGGSPLPRPGEVTLAHRGVLFLDELPEYRRGALESLRQPLEDGTVALFRAAGGVRYPADFVLVAAMNPCPCGFAGDADRPCVCDPGAVARYRNKVSGPLLDRIDLHVPVRRVPVESLSGAPGEGESSRTVRDYRNKVSGPLLDRIDLHVPVRRVPVEALGVNAPGEGESSRIVRDRVLAARETQAARFDHLEITTNGQMTVRQIAAFCAVSSGVGEFLERAIDRLGLSARGYHRILRVSRTIADLADAEQIEAHHAAEALQYRALDRRSAVA